MMKDCWEVKKLGEVCEVINGFAFKSTLFKDDGEPILRISNIQNGIITLDNVVYFEKKDYKIKLDKYKVYPNDILIALSGATTGKVGVNKTNLELYLNQRVALCREKEFHLRGYISYFLQTKTKELLSIAGGVAQPNLSTEQIKNLDIYSPSLDEQSRIVEELDQLSNIIEKKRQQLSELDNLAQSIFYDMFGDPVTNEKGWEVKRWENVLTIINGKNQSKVENPNGEYPIYGSGGIIGQANDYLCPNNTIIIGRKGNINKPLFVNQKFWNVDTAFGLVSNVELMEPRYLFFFCGIFDFEQLNKAVTIPSLTKKDLLQIDIPLPPLSLQQLFAQKIEAIEKEKELIKQSIKETEELFNSRMDYYFG